MVDSSPAELLNGLQDMYTNWLNNLSNQKTKGVIKNGEALEVRLLYEPNGDNWMVSVRHVKTGLGISDTYTDYATALNTYNGIT